MPKNEARVDSRMSPSDPETTPRPTTRTLTGWIEDLSGKSYAAWALFAVAFIEGSLFPLPPDPLFIALSLGNPRRAFRFAAIAAVGSVLGSFAGYAIGLTLFDSVGRPLLQSAGALDAFTAVLGRYREHGVMTLILAGFTPVPYSVMAMAAGFNGTLSLATLAIGSILSRAIRFGLLATLLALFGESVKHALRVHRRALAAGAILLCLLVFALVRWVL